MIKMNSMTTTLTNKDPRIRKQQMVLLIKSTSMHEFWQNLLKLSIRMLKSISLVSIPFPETPIIPCRQTCHRALHPFHNPLSANKTECKNNLKNYKSKIRLKRNKRKENRSRKRKVEELLKLYPNSLEISSNKINQMVKILLIVLKIVLYPKPLILLLRIKVKKR